MLPLKETRIRLGGWWSADPALISDEYMKLIADTGCDFIMSAGMGDTEKINELLTLCDKYGIECVVLDYRLYDRDDVPVGDITKDYIHHPSFVGCMVKDEPGTAHFDHLRRVYDRFRAETPGKDAYINLLPMYASADQLMYGADVQKIDYYTTESNTYADHLDAYCRRFDTPYVCVDVYPCRTAEDGKTREIYPGYLENLSQIAHVCRKYDRELWIMVQSLIWYDNATAPDEIDLRWQFYTVMAFGAAAIFHYCLATPPGHSAGLVDSEGKIGPLFYPAQRFHRYLKSVEDLYLSYKNVGCFNVNCTEDHPYLSFEEQYEDFGTISEIVSDDQLLVGCFEKKDGCGSAFVLVNMTRISERRTAHAKLRLDGAKRVTAHLDNVTLDIASTDGYYEFTLPCGEGVFVTVE